MASEADSGPAADDTVVVRSDAGAPDDDTALLDEDTLATEAPAAEEEWPVAEPYRIGPTESEAPRAAPEETVADADAVQAPRRRSFPPVMGPGVMAAIAAVVGGLILAAVVLQLRDGDEASADGSPATSTTPTVPTDTTPTTTEPRTGTIALRDLVGMPLAKARGIVEKADLEVRVTRQPSERPRDEVLEQIPPAGTKLAEGGLVTLVASSGTQQKQQTAASVSVPDVVGFSASDAVVAVRDAGLVARIRLVSSSEQAGMVLRQSPAGGSEAKRGSAVRLDVAKSRPVAPARVDVPDLVGMTVEGARSQLRSLGLTSTVVNVSSDEPAGTVVGQSPGAGAELRKGEGVTLRVSSGPSKIDVPDVTGRDEQSARAELEGTGFEVRVQEESTSDPAQDGIVLAQAPGGGTTATKGSVVTLTVGRLD